MAGHRVTRFRNVNDYIHYVGKHLDEETRRMLTHHERGKRITKQKMMDQLFNIAPLFAKKMVAKQKM